MTDNSYGRFIEGRKHQFKAYSLHEPEELVESFSRIAKKYNDALDLSIINVDITHSEMIPVVSVGVFQINSYEYTITMRLASIYRYVGHVIASYDITME